MDVLGILGGGLILFGIGAILCHEAKKHPPTRRLALQPIPVTTNGQPLRYGALPAKFIPSGLSRWPFSEN